MPSPPVNIACRVMFEPSPTPSIPRDATSIGMQIEPAPVDENQSTARGNVVPLGDVLKTLKFEGFWSMEISTAAVQYGSLVSIFLYTRPMELPDQVE